MNILFDLRALQDGSRQRGIGRYNKELIKHLKANYSSTNYQFLFDKNMSSMDNDFIQNHRDNSIYYVPSKPFWISRHSNKYKKDYIAKTINDIETDMVHFTSQIDLNPYIKQKYIITVHDIISHIFNKKPFFYGGQIKYFYNRDLNIFKDIINKACKIITVSNHSKKDIVRELSIEEDKIEVVYNGIGEQFRKIKTEAEVEAVLSKYSIKQPYILYAGAMEERKNLSELLKIFNAFKQSYGRDYKLVIVGKIEDVSYENTLKKKHESPDIIFTDYVPDDDLVCLYRGSHFFLFLSLYEGFGLPPLEAMAQGVPVIALKNSSIPEVLGDAAYYVESIDKKDIISSMIRMSEEEELRKNLSKKGIDQAKKYSWDNAAKETMKIYEKVLLGN